MLDPGLLILVRTRHNPSDLSEGNKSAELKKLDPCEAFSIDEWVHNGAAKAAALPPALSDSRTKIKLSRSSYPTSP